MKLCLRHKFLRSFARRILDWLGGRVWRTDRMLHPGVALGQPSMWCLCGREDCDNCSEPGDQDIVFITTLVSWKRFS